MLIGREPSSRGRGEVIEKLKFAIEAQARVSRDGPLVLVSSGSLGGSGNLPGGRSLYAQRFMGRSDLQPWTRIGDMNLCVGRVSAASQGD